MSETLWVLLVLASGALATYVWRFAGVYLSGKIDPESPIFEWTACVAYALLTAVIARMILMPNGPLAQTEAFDRVGAAVLALVIYFLTRKNLLLGVGSAFAVLVLMTWGRGL